MGVKGLIARGVPPMAKWLIFIKGAILILSLIIFCLACYGASIYPPGVAGFMIFLSILSWIVFGGTLAFEFWLQKFYFRIVVLIFYLFAIVFWLAGWAWSAAWAGAEFAWGGSIFGAVMAAIAGLGAITWVLAILLTVFFIMACIKNDASTDPNTTTAATPGNVELGGQPPMQYPAAGTVPPTQAYPTASPVYGQQQPDQTAAYPPQYGQQYPQQPYGQPTYGQQ